MTDGLQQRIASLEKKVRPGSKSPLFAQLASFYVEVGRPQDALRVCDNGLALFPFYTTGHLVKGKALAALSMNAEAKREFEWVLDFLPGNPAAAGLLAKLSVAAPSAVEEVAPGKESTPTLIGSRMEEPEPAAPPSVEQAAPPSHESAAPEVEPIAEAGLPAQEAPAATSDIFGLPSEPESPPAMREPASVEPLSAAETAPAEPVSAETPAEDPFGFGASPAEPPAPEPTTSSFDAFGAAETPEAPPSSSPTPEPSGPSIFDFPASQEPGAPASAGESFEDFAARMQATLGGEGTLSLEDYLKEETPSPAPPNEIEDIAQKLQSAKKITPIINFAAKSTATASEADTPSGSGFVTPTLAEIYAKQGWFDDAIKAYRTLASNKPAERERFEQRIAELEEQKKKQEG
ncbi:MAG TPA: hypothetical protein VMM57_04835 [Bacteroidota bacterium]|nr:hypothetical protein [Bacteroidota bacterium]